MADPKSTKPGSRWPIDSSTVPPSPARKDVPASAPDARREPTPPTGRGATGRVVHDERGNAVWDWLKETGRIAMESTSALWKRLEVSDLEVEGEKDDAVRLESERDPGGGYDPYNQKTPVKKFPPSKGKPSGRK